MKKTIFTSIFLVAALAFPIKGYATDWGERFNSTLDQVEENRERMEANVRDIEYRQQVQDQAESLSILAQQNENVLGSAERSSRY